MADNYYNPFVDAAQGMSRFGDSLSGLALGMAQQRYQQQQAQQMMQLRQAELMQQGALRRQQGKAYESQAALDRANEMLAGQKMKHDEQTQAAKGQLGDAAWMASMVQAGEDQGIDMGPRGDIARSRMLQAMGQLPDAARSHFPENLAQMNQMGDPRMQQMLATGTKMTSAVAPGATLFDNLEQEPMYVSPRTLNQGQTLVPGQGGAAIATGLPPRQAALNDPTQRMIGSLSNFIKPYNEVGNEQLRESDPLYHSATNALAPLLKGVAEQGIQKQGAPTQTPATAPQPGEVRKGYRFKGGNPADKNNWEKVN